MNKQQLEAAELKREMRRQYDEDSIARGFRERDSLICGQLADIGRRLLPHDDSYYDPHIPVWTGYEYVLEVFTRP